MDSGSGLYGDGDEAHIHLSLFLNLPPFSHNCSSRPHHRLPAGSGEMETVLNGAARVTRAGRVGLLHTTVRHSLPVSAEQAPSRTEMCQSGTIRAWTMASCAARVKMPLPTPSPHLGPDHSQFGAPSNPIDVPMHHQDLKSSIISTYFSLYQEAEIGAGGGGGDRL